METIPTHKKNPSFEKLGKRELYILQAKTAPHLPRFFYYGTALNYFISSRCLKIHSIAFQMEGKLL